MTPLIQNFLNNSWNSSLDNIFAFENMPVSAFKTLPGNGKTEFESIADHLECNIVRKFLSCSCFASIGENK
jgi:hypothetical protein